MRPSGERLGRDQKGARVPGFYLTFSAPKSVSVVFGLSAEEASNAVAAGQLSGGGHLTHAYAITGQKAQGMTTGRASVLGDETVYREWGYVAMSLGTEEKPSLRRCRRA